MKKTIKIFFTFFVLLSRQMFGNEQNTYERFISIGNCCLPRMEINRYLSKKYNKDVNCFGGGQLFDWLVIHDYNKFAEALENHLVDLFEYSDLKLAPSWNGDYLYVKNMKYAMTWNHLFTRFSNGTIDLNIINKEYGEKKAKIDYLSNKFRLLNQYRTLYILSYAYPLTEISPILTTAPDQPTILRVRDALEHIRGNNNFTLLFCPIQKTFEDFGNILVRTIVDATAGFPSKEQDQRWNEILSEFSFSLIELTIPLNDGSFYN